MNACLMFAMAALAVPVFSGLVFSARGDDEPLAAGSGDRAHFATTEAYIEHLEHEVGRLAAALSAVRAELEAVRKEGSDTDARAHAIEEHNAALEREIASLRAEIDRLRPASASQSTEQHTVVFELAADPGDGPLKVMLHWDGMLAANALVAATPPETTRVEALLPKGVGALALRYASPPKSGRKLHVVGASIDGMPIEVTALKYVSSDGPAPMPASGAFASGQIIISRSDLPQATLASGTPSAP